MKLLYCFFCIVFLTFCGTYELSVEEDFQNSNRVSVEILVENVPETFPSSEPGNLPIESVLLSEEPSVPPSSETEDYFFEDILPYEALSGVAQGLSEPPVKEDSQSSKINRDSSKIVMKDVEEEPPLPETGEPSIETVLLHAKPPEFVQIPLEEKPVFPVEEKPLLSGKKGIAVMKPVQEGLPALETADLSLATVERPVPDSPSSSETADPSLAAVEKHIPESEIDDPSIETVLLHKEDPPVSSQIPQEEEPILSQAERLAGINSVLDEGLFIFKKCKVMKNYILLISWEIDENGRPQNIDIKNPLKDKSLMDCLINEIKELQFSKSLQGPIETRFSLFTEKPEKA